MISLRFANKKLEKAFLEQKAGAKMWSEVVARKYIERLNAIQSVASVAEIASAFPWLRDHALKGDLKGTRAFYLHDRWRVEYQPDADGKGVFINKVSNHYGD